MKILTGKNSVLFILTIRYQVCLQMLKGDNS